MIEDGVIERLRQRWEPKRTNCERDPVEPSNLLDIVPLCAILSFGGLMSIELFCIEVSIRKLLPTTNG